MAVEAGKKIARKYLVHYINATPSGTATYERLGEDLEELGIELNPTVDTKKNILGETSTNLTGYEKQASVEPYYAKAGTELFNFLQSIIDDEKTLDDVKTDIVEVHTWEETTEGAYIAYKQDVVIAVKSYGGNTDGYQIPFDIYFVGNKKKGTFTPSDSGGGTWSE